MSPPAVAPAGLLLAGARARSVAFPSHGCLSHYSEKDAWGRGAEGSHVPQTQHQPSWALSTVTGLYGRVARCCPTEGPPDGCHPPPCFMLLRVPEFAEGSSWAGLSCVACSCQRGAEMCPKSHTTEPQIRVGREASDFPSVFPLCFPSLFPATETNCSHRARVKCPGGPVFSNAWPCSSVSLEDSPPLAKGPTSTAPFPITAATTFPGGPRLGELRQHGYLLS